MGNMAFELTYSSYEAKSGDAVCSVEYSAFGDGKWSATCLHLHGGDSSFIGTYSTRERAEAACAHYLATGWRLQDGDSNG